MEELSKLAALVDSHPDWWRFPTEGVVKGFMGTGDIMIVGDQPSTSPWEHTHPNRRVFYDALVRVSAGDAHLTDLYKRRGGSGALKHGIPSDFFDHVVLFKREVALLQPTHIVALGGDAYKLLQVHVPELRSRLHLLWHFSYVARYGKKSEYDDRMRAAFGMHKG